MATLIDGYNLLHIVGILGGKVGPGGLERARDALLGFLARSLTAAERAATTVVFDASQGPLGLPREQNHRGVRVLFAVGHDDADALLEQLIREDSAPRQLVVVSSDHQIQRAAKRRRATAIDSDLWYDEMQRRRHAREVEESRAHSDDAETMDAAEDRSSSPGALADAAYWIRVFSQGVDSDETDAAADDPGSAPNQQAPIKDVPAEHDVRSQSDVRRADDPRADSSSGKSERDKARDKSRDKATERAARRARRKRSGPAKPNELDGDKLNLGNPFPPGYAHDLLEDEEPD